MLSFMHMLKGAGGLPGSDTFAFCSDKLEGTDLSACPDWPAAIKTCQVNGKKVMMSIGGATMEDSFADDEEAKAMAKTVWDIYGGGSSDKRPYGDIKLDGFDVSFRGSNAVVEDILTGPSWISRTRSPPDGLRSPGR